MQFSADFVHSNVQNRKFVWTVHVLLIQSCMYKLTFLKWFFSTFSRARVAVWPALTTRHGVLLRWIEQTIVLVNLSSWSVSIGPTFTWSPSRKIPLLIQLISKFAYCYFIPYKAYLVKMPPTTVPVSGTE